ncbi:ankyrin repeat domain-containing protein [Chloropicon primus]|uniref:Uncharacterized protein n=1 Tax=Chloropicon primus TaxID=1764295 RepID=A0A5B8MIH2_9CHLO|nr:hypothetical protein A3770_03p23820 [Chloropicon primus]UPQ99075.1 ankyrin repeat domain-containing protein [Chloropicon primus]|eukprot:QDZ19864.1 hypothetical protein A3770_03p23820 [Chloropicon primus]
MGLRRKSNWDLSKPVFNRKDLEEHSLHHAVSRCDVDSLQKLIDTDVQQCITLADSVNAKDGLLKATPLHTAAEEGNCRVAKFLLMNEADILAKDKHGNEPLHLASVRGHTDLINLFIEKGAFVNNRNNAGNTALHYAANKGMDSAVTLLMRKGAVVNSRNANGWCPIHLAVVSAHFETVRLLVSKGADLNSQDQKGNSPLHLACECNNIGMVDYLMKNGAKTTLENKAFQVPGDLASRPVIKDILGWKPQHQRRLSSNTLASTSDESGKEGAASSGELFRKPKPLENKFLARVKSTHTTQPVNSPESFQDRMKRLTREKRKSLNNKIVLKKDEEGARRGSKATHSWNKRFLKKYGLNSRNLFAP